MDAFWSVTRIMLRDRRRVALALVFVFISAGGLGAGVLSVLPLLRLILGGEDGQSLVDLAREFNAHGWLITIPEAVIAILPTDPFHGVLTIMGGLIVLTLIGATCNFLHMSVAMTMVTKTIARLRLAAFRSVVLMPLGRVVEQGPAQFVARIVRDAAELQRGLLALTSKAVAQISKGAAAFVAAVFIEWRLTIVAAIVAPILYIMLRKFGKRIRRGTKASLEGQQDLLRISSETIQGLRAVKANTGERRSLSRFHVVNKEVVRQELRVRTARALASPAVETLAVISICVLAVVAAREIIAGNLAFERFIAALVALGVAGGSFRPLTGLVNEIQAASAPAQRLMDIVDEEQETAGDLRRPILSRHQRDIVFESVGFTYPGAESPALEDVSLRIEHGRRIAIVGPNGCGKTTLVSMLPRLLSPDRGRILIDGTDIAAVNLRYLRKQIGVVTQDTVLFRISIAENIAFGAEPVSREKIIDAARRAHADEFIQRIPGGYDADLAEQGASLSGGQRQRLAIARAILRDPSILILDEATSQIDAESEEHINAALSEFSQGRTAIVIAHRLASVLHADMIVVMDEGRIISTGTHDDLLERCDLYRRLTRTQLVPAN